MLKGAFSNSEALRPTLNEVSIPCLSSTKVESFSTRFLPSKVDAVVADIYGSKSL